MADDPTYTDKIRKLTTAAEQDDAVTAGRILTELGPEQWSKAMKDMKTLNKQDWGSHLDVNIPIISVEMVSNGTKETIKLVQQPTRDDAGLQPVAEASCDTKGKKIDNPIDPSADLVRQLTTAAEDGDAVATARILKNVGPDKWGSVTKDMIKMNRDDRRKAFDDPSGIKKIPARLTISYKQDSGEETLKVYQEAEMQLQVPLVKVTDKH